MKTLNTGNACLVNKITVVNYQLSFHDFFKSVTMFCLYLLSVSKTTSSQRFRHIYIMNATSLIYNDE